MVEWQDLFPIPRTQDAISLNEFNLLTLELHVKAICIRYTEVLLVIFSKDRQANSRWLLCAIEAVMQSPQKSLYLLSAVMTAEKDNADTSRKLKQ